MHAFDVLRDSERGGDEPRRYPQPAPPTKGGQGDERGA